MDRLDRWIRRISGSLAVVAGICLVLMLGQIVLDVILKYLFNAPIEGNLEIVSTYYMVGVVFLPLAMVELRHEHISVELLVRMFPPRVRSAFYLAGCLVSLVFFGILTYRTFLDAVHATRVNEMLMGSIYVTIWPSRWMLPVGFAAIALAVLVHAYHSARDPGGFDPSPAAPETPLPDRR